VALEELAVVALRRHGDVSLQGANEGSLGGVSLGQVVGDLVGSGGHAAPRVGEDPLLPLPTAGRLRSYSRLDSRRSRPEGTPLVRAFVSGIDTTKDVAAGVFMLEKRGELVFRTTTSTDGLERDYDRFLRLEASGWKGLAGTAIDQDPRADRLFRNFAAGAVREGWLQALVS
jgi:hypothetical protein